MKKGKKVLALFLATVLTVTGIAWDFSKSEASSTQSAGTTQSRHVKYDFMNMTDTSVLNQDFTSYLKGQSADENATDNWFLGKTGTGAETSERSGLKPKSRGDWYYLMHKNTYKNFLLTMEVNPDSNLGIVLGDVNLQWRTRV